MRKKIILVVVVMVLVISFSGCGRNDPNSVPVFAGEWALESIEDNGNVTNLADYAEVGLSGGLTLNEDMSMTFDLLGDITKGTWKALNSVEITMSFDGTASVNGMLSEDKLLIEEDNTKFVFAKK